MLLSKYIFHPFIFDAPAELSIKPDNNRVYPALTMFLLDVVLINTDPQLKHGQLEHLSQQQLT